MLAGIASAVTDTASWSKETTRADMLQSQEALSRQFARCEMQAAKIHNGPPDYKGWNYIRSCMRAEGYELKSPSLAKGDDPFIVGLCIDHHIEATMSFSECYQAVSPTK
jgi:hypothetical protein